MQNSIEEPSKVEPLDTNRLLNKIKENKWWQGSLILASDLPSTVEENKHVDWWVIATQPCNLFNPDFHKVPVFEIVAAFEIEECSPRMIKGDDPRVLHLKVKSEDEVKALKIDIQKRMWLPRTLLAELPASQFHIRDANSNIAANEPKIDWLDNFIGWMARSYTRIALPDEFNSAIQKSKIETIFKDKLTKYHEQLYGIYLAVDQDSDEEWQRCLGEMPPPYLLEILLVTYEDADPEFLKDELIKHLFENKVSDPDANEKQIARAELAHRYQVRIIKPAISAKNMAEVSLKELKRYVRYSFVDHLSNASAAAGE